MTYEAFIALYCFLALIVLIIIGVPIYAAIFIPTIVGIYLIGGSTALFVYFTNGPFNEAQSYTFAVVPMFILMGMLASESGLAEAIFDVVRKWTSRIPGGLLISTIFANAIFGACCAISLAANAIFTKIAIPQLDKYGYNRRLSLGCIVSSGILSSLIPPSVPILVFCILTNLSIGRALLAGVVPGIITAFSLAAIIFITWVIKPNWMPPPQEGITWKSRFSAVIPVFPVILLLILIIGGISFGIFSSTVGGAVGAAGVLLYAFIKRLGKDEIYASFKEMVIMNAQIFMIMVAGLMFSRLTAMSGLATALTVWVSNINVPPAILISIILVFYLLLGTALEALPIIIITISIIFPLVTSLGFDPYAFCIANVFLGSLAGLSPPVALNVFIVASAAKTDPMEVNKGLLPFVIVLLILLWVFMFVPTLSTWLPNLLLGPPL